MDTPRFDPASLDEFNFRSKNVNSLNTQKANTRAANTFRQYLIEKGCPKVDFEHFSKLELNDVLRIIYFERLMAESTKRQA